MDEGINGCEHEYTKCLGPYFAVLLSTLVGSWLANPAARTQSVTVWDAGIAGGSSNPLFHNASSSIV